jgi:hypothetical protein
MRIPHFTPTALGASALFATVVFAQEAAAPPDPPKPAVTAKGETISPKGRSPDVMNSKLVDRPARYYIWVDSQGWHLRTAAPERNTKFSGTLELSDGAFGKLREVGLELKSTKAPDAYRIDATRRKLEFSLTTWKGPDGLDFEITKGKDAEIAFDLKVADKPQPGRVFIGKENKSPSKSTFTLPAEP